MVHNLGAAAEATIKEWLKIAAALEKNSGFATKISQVYDLLFEVSKLCAPAHGDQRNDRATDLEAY